MQANPKTVIVLLNGGPVSLAPPYAGGGQRAMATRYPTVLDMFWAGEEGGTAIADVLFGDYNPSGRMPYTVYASERALPPMTEYDISKGFTYMYLNDKPVFAFGRGLSYTNFDYSNLGLSSGTGRERRLGEGACRREEHRRSRRRGGGADVRAQ